MYYVEPTHKYADLWSSFKPPSISFTIVAAIAFSPLQIPEKSKLVGF